MEEIEVAIPTGRSVSLWDVVPQFVRKKGQQPYRLPFTTFPLLVFSVDVRLTSGTVPPLGRLYFEHIRRSHHMNHRVRTYIFR